MDGIIHPHARPPVTLADLPPIALHDRVDVLTNWAPHYGRFERAGHTWRIYVDIVDGEALWRCMGERVRHPVCQCYWPVPRSWDGLLAVFVAAIDDWAVEVMASAVRIAAAIPEPRREAMRRGAGGVTLG